MNDILRIARLKIALQRAFLGRAILIFTVLNMRIGVLNRVMQMRAMDIQLGLQFT